MISNCSNRKELENLKDEIVDIYGKIPDELNNLMIISEFKQKVSHISIEFIKIYNNSVSIKYKKDEDNMPTKFKIYSDDLKIMCEEIISIINNSN